LGRDFENPAVADLMTLSPIQRSILTAIFNGCQIVADERGQMEIARLVVAGLLKIDESCNPERLIMGTAGFGAMLMPEMLHPPVAGDYADN
jgi:hypothetical protein